MKIKKGVKNYSSLKLSEIFLNTSRKDIEKFIFYCLEDCLKFGLNFNNEEVEKYVEIVRKGEREALSTVDNIPLVGMNAVRFAFWSLHTGSLSYPGWLLSSASGTFVDMDSKQKEYLSYARMFLHEKEHNPIPNTPKLNSEYNIALFLDQLEDHNIFVHENFELKLPKGYQIKGGDKLDLVNKIAGSRFAIDYLNYLFQSEI